jgi:hypothetical protein
VLRRIYEPIREKLKGGWRKLVSRLFTKFYLGNKTKNGGTCSTRGRDKTVA